MELEIEERKAQRAGERQQWQERVEDARTVMEKWGLPALHLQTVAGERGPHGRKRGRSGDSTGEEALRGQPRRRADDGGDSGAGPSLAGWAHDDGDDGAGPSLATDWDPNHDDESE